MDDDRAAAYMGIGVTKFRELVAEGKLPSPVYLDDGCPRWDRLDLDHAFDDLKERRRDPVKRSRDRLEERLKEQEDED